MGKEVKDTALVKYLADSAFDLVVAVTSPELHPWHSGMQMLLYMAQAPSEGWQESRPSPNSDVTRLYRDKFVYHVAPRVFLVSHIVAVIVGAKRVSEEPKRVATETAASVTKLANALSSTQWTTQGKSRSRGG